MNFLNLCKGRLSQTRFSFIHFWDICWGPVAHGNSQETYAATPSPLWPILDLFLQPLHLCLVNGVSPVACNFASLGRTAASTARWGLCEQGGLWSVNFLILLFQQFGEQRFDEVWERQSACIISLFYIVANLLVGASIMNALVDIGKVTSVWRGDVNPSLRLMIDVLRLMQEIPVGIAAVLAAGLSTIYLWFWEGCILGFITTFHRVAGLYCILCQILVHLSFVFLCEEELGTAPRWLNNVLCQVARIPHTVLAQE